MEWWQLLILSVVSLLVSVFSGIAGGGGGFVTTPLLILFGLTPAQAVATGKINGLAIAVGSLSGMRSLNSRLSIKNILPLIILALVVGIIAPNIIQSLDSQVYRLILGFVLLLMIPVLLIKKIGVTVRKPSLWQKSVGGVLLAIALFLQGVFSGGLGTLVNMVLMGLMGLTAAEANVAKRWAGLVLNIAITTGLLFSGLILWYVLLVLVPATALGGYIGGKIAIKKGNKFILNAMIVLVVISATYLIAGAI